MKKIVSIVILGVLLVGSVAPAVATAQSTKLQEYCTIKNDMTWTSGKICKPSTGNTEDSTCDTSGDCAAAGTNCVLEKSIHTIGPSYSVVTSYDSTSGDADGWVTHYADQWGMICLVNSVNTITNWIFYLLMIIVVVMVVIGGATYMLSAGNPERAGKGKSIIIYGVIGLVIALLARLIPSLVKVIVGMG